MAEPESIVTENQRLKKELRKLQERVAAFESSRWWRLHPRFLLRRRPKSQRSPSQIAPATPAPDDGVSQRFREEVVERGTFTEDWFTVHVPDWTRVLARFDGKAARVLELGSYEGLSACFVLWRLPDSQITCIDTFVGIAGYAPYGIDTNELERKFDDNVALVNSTRVRKLAGSTHSVLPDLIAEKQSYNLIYVDASHTALDVLADVALAWQLLERGGVMIFDDYGPAPPGEDQLQYPQVAIDAFLRVVDAEPVSDARQLMVSKR